MVIVFYDEGFLVHDHFDVLTATEEYFIGAAVTEILDEIGDYVEARFVE